jgi:hypothetical protein
MTRILRTVDGGEIEFGFWGVDVSRIQMGEAPPMQTTQFAGYAALTLIGGVFPKLTQEKQAEWASDVRYVRETVDPLPILRLTGAYSQFESAPALAAQIDRVAPEDQADFAAAIRAAGTPVEPAVAYTENPFIAREDGQAVRIADRHEVSADEFFNVTNAIIVGGYMGWGELGTYQEVKDAAVMLDEALSPPPQALPPATA